MRALTRVVVLLSLGCGSTPAAPDAGSDAPVTADAPATPDTPPARDTWASSAMGFFQTYCVECHAGAPSGRDYRTITDVVRDAALIRCGVAPTSEPTAGCTAADPEAGLFPIGTGPFPSDDERRRIVAWIDDGLPE